MPEFDLIRPLFLSNFGLDLYKLRLPIYKSSHQISPRLTPEFLDHDSVFDCRFPRETSNQIFHKGLWFVTYYCLMEYVNVSPLRASTIEHLPFNVDNINTERLNKEFIICLGLNQLRVLDDTNSDLHIFKTP